MRTTRAYLKAKEWYLICRQTSKIRTGIPYVLEFQCTFETDPDYEICFSCCFTGKYSSQGAHIQELYFAYYSMPSLIHSNFNKEKDSHNFIASLM